MKIIIKNSINELNKLISFISNFQKKHFLNQEITKKLHLILEEIISNVINYAYNDELEHFIEIKLFKLKDYTKIIVIDDGISFNPLEYNLENNEVELSNKKIGGLGIYLIKKISDKIKYKRIKKLNVLIIYIKI